METPRHNPDLVESNAPAAIVGVADHSQSRQEYCYAAPEAVSHSSVPDLTHDLYPYDNSLHRSPEPSSFSAPTSPTFNLAEQFELQKDPVPFLEPPGPRSDDTFNETLFGDDQSQRSLAGSATQLLSPAEENPTVIHFSHQTSYDIPKSVLEFTEQLQTNYGNPGLCSSSPGIGSPARAVSSGGQTDGSPEQMAVSSLIDCSMDSQFSDGSLHQSLELILASPNMLLSEYPQPGFDPLCAERKVIAPVPVPAHSIAHPQFVDGCVQQSLAVSPSSSVDPVDQSRSGDEEDYYDISALEYARKNGLSRDYLKEPYFASNLDVFGDHQNGLTYDCHLPKFDLTADINTDERLALSKDAALLIASVSQEETSAWSDSTMLRMIAAKKRQNFRLELPLLRSDHETDCKKFAQREGFEIKLQDVKLPLEMVDEQNNEGLEFSSSLWGKGEEVLENLKKEKLEVSRVTLVYLQNNLKEDWTEEDDKAIYASLQTYRRVSFNISLHFGHWLMLCAQNTALEPVTPPLSPMKFPAELFEPSLSDPVFDVLILSDPASLTKEDLEALEKQIYDEDAPTPIKNARDHNRTSSETLIGSPIIKLADVYSPVASLDETPIYPDFETKRLKRDELKVEEPLTPAKPHELPNPVPFGDTVMECPIAPGSQPTDPFEASFFEEAFGAAHQKATRMSEQETLIPADTMARVEVPVMDFSLPSPPWSTSQTNTYSSSFLSWQQASMKNSIGYGLLKWPLSGKHNVRYNPFPHEFAKVALEEGFIVDDSTWKAFFQGPGDDEVIDTSTLTWKPPGLRIFRDEDDDEIEAGNFEIGGPPPDISYLVKKRKIEIEERSSGHNHAVQDELATSVKQPPRKKTPKPADFVSSGRMLQPGRMTEGGLLMGGAFSVENSVENYLEIRGTKKAKLVDNTYLAKTSAQAETQQPLAKTSPVPELLPQPPIRNSPAPKTPTPLPAPASNIPNDPVNVIVASSLLKHRGLIKHIETSFPSLVLIERDFMAHTTTVWQRGSVARSPIASPLASEADIIISPLLGIIIANLQKIKQKPLPGQKTKSAIRERLEKVSAKYEKLLVLVTEDRADETTRELDESDCIALSIFVAFSLSLQSTVTVQFVGGGQATLAKWLVGAIVRYGVGGGLLADETHWELFLRRAGLNAFAAQHVIASVKPPEGVDGLDPAQFGLAAFANMGTEQRITRFGAVCGHRVMARVSAVVEGRWS